MNSTNLSASTPARELEQWRLRDRSGEVSASEPASVFAIKSLLYPVIPALTLFACLVFWNEPFYGPYILVGVLSFLGVADLLDVMPPRITPLAAMALRSFIDIGLRWSVLMIFLYTLLDLSALGHYFSKPVLISWAFVTPVVLWVGEMTAQRLLDRVSMSRRTRKAVVIGASSRAVQLDATLVAKPTLRIQVVGFFDNRSDSRVPPECEGRILGNFEDVASYVSREGIDIVYITLPMSPQPRVMELLSSLRDSTASIYFVPDLSVFDLVQPRFDIVDGIPVIAVCESPFYGVRGIAKRASDIVIASAAIVLLAPVFAFAAIGVKWSSPGPIIYRQKRYGLDGKEIIVYKFRSLRVENDNAPLRLVTRNDARITPFGAFIRRTSLDELPQLFNVLLGNMSIVGPRPHAVAVNENYRRLIPGYMVRHKVKPGITGWAQVNGYRGGDDLHSMTMRINYDLEYLRHWSLGFDFIIIIKTAFMVWKDRHAY
jgi:putative colanic acid biosynthesis UDP-glucose lipid carrier transferase